MPSSSFNLDLANADRSVAATVDVVVIVENAN
jgi:hypothetical protein